MRRFYLGVDPGKTGAAAVLDAAGRIVRMFQHGQDVLRLVRECEAMGITPDNAFVALERQQPMRRYTPDGVAVTQGVASTFTTGMNYGQWLGALSVMGFSHAVVRPQEWGRVCGPETRKQKGKALKLKRAELFDRRWPESAGLIRGPRNGLKDGLVDAAFIALWGLREEQGVP